MKPIDVLFLCETNAATSLIAEALVNHWNDARIRAFSAGRAPAPAMIPEARAVLEARGISADALEPKAWSIFALPGARSPDVVVDLATVSWTHPEIAALSGGAVVRWPLQDPALLSRRAERRAATNAVIDALAARIDRELMKRIEKAASRPDPLNRAVA